MKKVIIFDFWGTLVEQGVYSPIKQVRRILDLESVNYPEFVSRLQTAMMREKFGSLNDAFEKVLLEFKIELNKNIIEELIGVWNKNWLLAMPYNETVEVLKKLKKNHTLVLIANTDEFSVNNVLQKFNLVEFFDLVCLSYNEGILKNDISFYKNIISKLNVDFNDCLVVGDSIESDIKIAQREGIDAVLIDRRNRRDFEKKIIDLTGLLKEEVVV